LPYSRDAVVGVGTADEKSHALDRALDAAALPAAVEEAAAAAGRPPGAVGVAIRPVLPAGASPESPPLSYTDPELVELLVARLAGAGAGTVTVVGAGPRLEETMAAVGYRPDGYAIADVEDDPVELDYRGALGPHLAGRAWAEAGMRILFGKNRTDRQLGFAGTMTTALGTVPRPGELRRGTRAGHDLAECARSVLEALPVGFALVDAWHSADGTRPPWRPGRARPTGAVLASRNAFALDWLMGELMDFDPALNPVVQEGLHRWGRIRLERRGNLTPWDGWRNPSPAVMALTDLRAKEVAWTAR
jgi:uncharacterized protein (DUF362 family)